MAQRRLGVGLCPALLGVVRQLVGRALRHAPLQPSVLQLLVQDLPAARLPVGQLGSGSEVRCSLQQSSPGFSCSLCCPSAAADAERGSVARLATSDCFRSRSAGLQPQTTVRARAQQRCLLNSRWSKMVTGSSGRMIVPHVTSPAAVGQAAMRVANSSRLLAACCVPLPSKTISASVSQPPSTSEQPPE